MSKKMAILLFGLSQFNESFHASPDEFCSYQTDYRLCINNFNLKIKQYFEKLGFEIDVYLATNKVSDSMQQQIINDYGAKSYEFLESHKVNHISRNEKFESVMRQCLDSKNIYDMILMTRFDIFINKSFDDCNLDFESFYVTSTLEKKHLICDNIYLFPYKFLRDFHKCILENYLDIEYLSFHGDVLPTISCHRLGDHIIKIVGAGNFKFLMNQPGRKISQLDFYTIKRTRKHTRKNKKIIIHFK